MKKTLILFLLAAVFLSCGSDKNEQKDEMNMARFFDAYLSTLCNASTQCASGFVTSQNLSFCPKVIINNPEPFEGFHKGENVVFKHKYNMMLNAEANGRIKVDMNQAEACFAVISKMAPCNPMDVQLLDIPECALVFNGFQYVKQDCNQDEECNDGWCRMAGGVCPGSCKEYKYAGQNCSSSLDKCAPGYECRSSVCSRTSMSEANDPCVKDGDCAAFLFCYVREGDSYGVCLKRKGEGEACSDANECVVGLSCVDNLCSRSRIGDSVGFPCGVQEETDENGNKIVLECNKFSKLECGLSKTCQKAPADSNLQCVEFCDSDKGLYCDSASHTCQWQKIAGSECATNLECASLYCAKPSEEAEIYVCREPECLIIENVE